MQRYVAVVWI